MSDAMQVRYRWPDQHSTCISVASAVELLLEERRSISAKLSRTWCQRSTWTIIRTVINATKVQGLRGVQIMHSAARNRFTFGLRALFITVAACALISAWVGSRFRDRDRRLLCGDWDVAQMRVDGIEWDTSRIEHIHFDGDSVHIFWYGETLTYRVQMDRLRAPGQVDLISSESDAYRPQAEHRPSKLDVNAGRFLGIYKFTGNTLTVCLNGSPLRPLGFLAPAGSEEILTVMHRRVARK